MGTGSTSDSRPGRLGCSEWGPQAKLRPHPGAVLPSAFGRSWPVTLVRPPGWQSGPRGRWLLVLGTRSKSMADRGESPEYGSTQRQLRQAEPQAAVEWAAHLAWAPRHQEAGPGRASWPWVRVTRCSVSSLAAQDGAGVMAPEAHGDGAGTARVRVAHVGQPPLPAAARQPSELDSRPCWQVSAGRGLRPPWH